MPSTEIKTLILGGNTYNLNDTAARALIAALQSALAAKANTADLGAVATSNDYNDLTNKPALGAVATSNDYNDLTNKPTALSSFTDDLGSSPTHTHSDKQATLVSGTNIKTVNGTSLLGSGNLAISGSGGGLTDYDLTAIAATSISTTATVLVSFAAATRGYKIINSSVDFPISITANNASDNYILVHNTGAAEITVTIAGVAVSGTALASTAIHTPTDGITVKAGEYVEIGVYANSSFAAITASQNLS